MPTSNEQFAELNERRDQLHAGLIAWPADHIIARPAGETWSATDVVEHLERTERMILRTMRTHVDAPHPVGLADRMRATGLNAMFRTPARVKTPSSASIVDPTGNLTYAEVEATWNETRADLHNFLNNHSSLGDEDGLFQHPVAGWMPIGTVLEFFNVHIVHHGYQLERLRKALTRA